MSRVAVVTGGASGIGLGIGQQLVADGHRVALLDRNGEGAKAAAAEIGSGRRRDRGRRGRPRFGRRPRSPTPAVSSARSRSS